jgi:hypothetical protein
LTTSIKLLDRNYTILKQLNKIFGLSQSPFLCKLEVLPFARGVLPRALFSSNSDTKISWLCGMNAILKEEINHQKLYIPVSLLFFLIFPNLFRNSVFLFRMEMKIGQILYVLIFQFHYIIKK